MTTDQPTTEKSLRKLTAQEFIDIITEVNKEKYAEFYQLNNHGNEHIVIKNVEILQEVRLTNKAPVNLPLVIESGTFGGNFLITDGIFNKNFRIRGGVFNQPFRIRGGTFNQPFSVQGGIFNQAFDIQGGTFIRSFGVTGGTFNGNFGIDDGAFSQDFSITGGTFNGDFYIFDGTFSRNFWVQDGTFSQNFLIQGGTFTGDFKIQSSTTIQKLSIVGGAFEKEIELRGGYIYKLSIDYVTSALRLRVLNDCQLTILAINATLPKDSLLRISGSLYCLTFEDVHNFGTILLTGLSFREQPYVPKGVTLPDDKDRPESPQLQIINSDLGKTNFIDCDLSGFGLEFKSSKITDGFVTGTKMPNRIITPDYRQQQLGYSQIKKIYENRGDKVEANRYYAREMDAYFTTLSWRNDLWEKFNLGLNKLSTDHGQNWQRGLLTTFGVGGMFYAVYCWLLGFGPALPTEHGATARFGEVSSYFMEFINPIHKADYVAQELLGEKAHVNGWARTIEGISRIFIAYFVYQLIQAFRKHGRSSS